MSFDWKQEYHRYHRYFVDLGSLYKNRRIIVYTGLTLTLLTISFFSLFALRPTITTILSLVKEIKEKKLVDQKLQTKINSLATAQANYSLKADSLTLLTEALPQEPNLPEIMWYLEFLAQKENFIIKSLNYDPIVVVGSQQRSGVQEKIDQPRSLNFSLSVSGNYENIVDFLGKLEALRRLIIINSINLTSSGTEETPTINLSLDGSFFHKPLEEKK